MPTNKNAQLRYQILDRCFSDFKRKKIIENQSIESLLHLSRGVFGADFGASSAVIKNTNNANACGTYFRLVERTFQKFEQSHLRMLFEQTLANHDFKYNFKENGIDQYKELVPNSRFEIDDDGIIPLMASNIEFTDAVTKRFKTWLTVTFGEEAFVENLNYIEKCLGKTLDAHFVKDFWKDHKKMYQNLPIYCLFSSAKGAFLCLVYMHRMNPYTAEKIRTNYLLPHIEWLVNKQNELQTNAANLSPRERKELDGIVKQIDECREYHDRLHIIADQQINFDLDDGVVINYAKFGDVLKKIKYKAMVNSIDRKAVTELMKGYYFYIPSYQRGYRWTSIQVVQLLSDLLCYASSTFNKRIQGINEGEYYCLQPVVARKITDKEVQRKFLPKDAKKDAEAWEIIDGQQRLTTLYILYKYLITKCNISVESLKEDEIELYHLTYATRKGSSAFLANIGNNDDECNDNIDFFHMSQAYETIDKWTRSIDEYELTGAKSLCQRYNLSTKVSDILNIFRSLLNAEKDKYSMYGSVQVLWYELADDKDAIKEFREINTGKIYLTDAELIKALFLRTQNLESQEHIQMQRALEWENIENTLQNDAFWCFLNAKGIDMPNRIDFIFNLRYKMETLSVLNQDDDNLDGKVDTLLRDCETKLATKNFVFNYFYDKFDGKSNGELIQALTTEWEEILNIFHTIEDWYEDVITYNLIGMLSQYQGNLLPKCYYHFNHMDENESRGEFKNWLKQKICDQTQNITVEQGHIDLSFGDSRIFNLLLLLNVHHLNKQAEGLESQSELSSIYKFPFDVLTKQGWDIEHIDSFTTNGLKEISSKKEWISIALEDLSMNEEERSFINELYEEGELDKAIEKIREIAKEWTDAPEEVKNNIGNLTLLDSGTNRSYGNSLFVVKRRKIIERMKAGIYVPVTTTYVFMKLFDENGTNRSRWGEEDMNKYQAYIYDELKDYLNIKK